MRALYNQSINNNTQFIVILTYKQFLVTLYVMIKKYHQMKNGGMRIETPMHGKENVLWYRFWNKVAYILYKFLWLYFFKSYISTSHANFCFDFHGILLYIGLGVFTSIEKNIVYQSTYELIVNLSVSLDDLFLYAFIGLT